jgi:hemoglobin
MRHAPFTIGPEERDRWLLHMRAAIDALAPEPTVREKLEEYFAFAAESMRNVD